MQHRAATPTYGATLCLARSKEKKEKKNTGYNRDVIVESRIKAGSASFLCKFEDGAVVAHTSQTSFHHVDNVM